MARLMSKSLPRYEWLGKLSYHAAFEIQLAEHRKCVLEESAGAIFGLEHSPAVITLGKHARREFLNASESWCQQNDVEIIRTDRGGEVTAHMPGQLVVYVVLPLRTLRLTPKQLVTLLEGSCVKLLADIGIQSSVDPAYPGVWISDRKIAALGVRIRSGQATMGSHSIYAMTYCFLIKSPLVY